MNAPKETNLQRTMRENAEAAERYRAEQDRDPTQKAMREALKPTKAEIAEREAAEAAVLEAEQAVGAAMLALNRAEHAKERPPRGFSFFQISKDSHKAAAATVAIPDLRVDLEEARSILGSAIKRRSAVAARIDAARMERRRAAKLKFAPAKVPVQSRADRWMHKGLGEVQ